MLFWILIGIYTFVAFIVVGIGVTITPKMPMWFVIVMACIWPITVAVGLGVSAAKQKGY